MKFFAGRKDGLGARLLPILNAARLASKIRVDFKFAWPAYPQQHAANNDFAEEIFHSDFVISYLIKRQLRGVDAECFVSKRENDSSLSFHVLNFDSTNLNSQENIIFSLPRVVYLLPHESKTEVLLEFKSILIEKALSKTILSRYKKWKQNNVSQIAGVHIRMGDVSESPLRQLRYLVSKYYPVTFFEEAYEAINEKYNACLCCSNNSNVVEHFSKNYGSLYIPADGLSPIQLGMLEILAMSDCKSLYGCQESAFLSCAAALGNAKVFDICSLLNTDTTLQIFKKTTKKLYYDIVESYFLIYDVNFIKNDIKLLKQKSLEPMTLEIARKRVLNTIKHVKMLAPREKNQFINKIYNSVYKQHQLFATLLMVLSGGGEYAVAKELMHRFESLDETSEVLKSVRWKRIIRELISFSKNIITSQNISFEEKYLKSLLVQKTNHSMQRYGSLYDGGYLLVELPGEYDLFLSGGVSGNIDFEIECSNRFKINCVAYDPSIDCLPKPHQSIIFKKMAIGGKNSITTTNLSDMLSGCNHALVKLDIEGAEYDWINSLSDADVIKIKQLVIEMHNPFQNNNLKQISKLIKTHDLVHAHANNVCGTFQYQNTFLPNTIECTFVRKSDSSAAGPMTLSLPNILDSPNNPCYPQITLKGYPFTI